MCVSLLFSRYFLKGTILQSLYCSVHVFIHSVSWQLPVYRAGDKGTDFRWGVCQNTLCEWKTIVASLEWSCYWKVACSNCTCKQKEGEKRREDGSSAYTEASGAACHFGKISWQHFLLFFFLKKIYSVEYSSVWQSGSVLSICVWRILPVLLHRSLCLLKWMIPAYLMYCCALQRTTE